MSQTRNQRSLGDEQSGDPGLDQSLKALLATHGYRRVLEHLVWVSQQTSQVASETGGPWRPSARYLMTLSPEEREPFLEAAAADALPLYEADLARPEAERTLTADLESGEFYDYPEAGADEAALETTTHG